VKYQDGQDVRADDEVSIKGTRARVKFIAVDSHSISGSWYLESLGSGVMFEIDGGGEYYCNDDVLAHAEDITLMGRHK
jgi:hypothetical protein